MRAEKNQEGGKPVDLPGNAVPAEQEHPEEDRFQEKRQYPLGGERGAENIADQARVLGPVCAEGKFQDDPRRGSDHENKAEYFNQKRGNRFVDLLVRFKYNVSSTRMISVIPNVSGGKIK